MKASSYHRRVEFRVLNKIRSPPRILCGRSSAGLTDSGSWISMTRARPIVASNGISSRPLPPRTKCRGASMCVPVCDPMESVETLAASPCSISSILSILTGGLSGQWTMPVRRGTEASIHPAFVFAIFPGSSASTQLPPCSNILIEVEGGADEGQVREGLREVAQGLTARSDLLRIKPYEVGVGEHLLEDEPGLLDPSGACE